MSDQLQFLQKWQGLLILPFTPNTYSMEYDKQEYLFEYIMCSLSLIKLLPLQEIYNLLLECEQIASWKH